jgi:PTH2 family peptidyl-tRNA hydrolase
MCLILGSWSSWLSNAQLRWFWTKTSPLQGEDPRFESGRTHIIIAKWLNWTTYVVVTTKYLKSDEYINNMSGKVKQVIVLREDLDISRGKEISQACHASLGAYRKADSEAVSQWEAEGAKKIVLSSGDRKLEDLYAEIKSKDIPAYLVKDAGKTEIESGTITALGIGPVEESKIDSITGELKLIG